MDTGGAAVLPCDLMNLSDFTAHCAALVRDGHGDLPVTVNDSEWGTALIVTAPKVVDVDEYDHLPMGTQRVAIEGNL